MNNCSICGWGVAWCVDKEDKGTYWLCGRCAVEDVTDFIKEKRCLIKGIRELDLADMREEEVEAFLDAANQGEYLAP